MSVIVYGPQGCGKTRNAGVMMRHFGLKHLIDNGFDEFGNPWNYDDPIPNDTLVLTQERVLPDDLDFYQVMKDISVANGCHVFDPRIREDLERDLPEVINKLSSPFNTGDVRRGLEIYGEMPSWLESVFIEVLISLGCEKIGRAYDSANTWFISPLVAEHIKNARQMADILEPFVKARTKSFTIKDLLEFMEIKEYEISKDFHTKAALALKNLCCIRIEPSWENPLTVWLPPAAQSIDPNAQDNSN